MVYRAMRNWLRAGDSRSWDDAVHGVYSTQCMMYLVCAVLGVYLYAVYACTRCMLVLCVCLYLVYASLGVNS